MIPFFGYARQDRKDQPRVPITAKLVANLIVAAGANRVLTMDLHAQQIMGFFDIPVDHLYAAPVIYRYFRKKKLNDLVVVSPDIGGVKMVNAFANIFHAPLAIVAKKRKSAMDVEVLNVVGDVNGKNVVMVDDLTETARHVGGGRGSVKTARSEEGVCGGQSRGIEPCGGETAAELGAGGAGDHRHGTSRAGEGFQDRGIDGCAAARRSDLEDS